MSRRAAPTEEDLKRMAQEQLEATVQPEVIKDGKRDPGTGFIFKPGKPLPEDYENPEPGQPFHRCVDLQGRYQPTWYSLKIHKGEKNMPSRQTFNCAGHIYSVAVGMWVDVPPEIIEVLGYTNVNVISMDMAEANPLVDRSVPRVVEEVPRFNYIARKSA